MRSTRQPQPAILVPHCNLAFNVDINNLRKWFLPYINFIYAVAIIFPLLEMYNRFR